jgi:hypothetical protein
MATISSTQSNSMTTVTAVSSGTIPVLTDAYLYDINTGIQVNVPEDAILVEMSVRRTNDTIMTANRSIIIGIVGDPTYYTGSYGIPTNNLNDNMYATVIDKPVDQITRFPQTVDVPITIRSGLLGDITNGQLLVSLKFKKFPPNRPISGFGGAAVSRHLLA